jgi:hypothetical protein
MCDYSLMAIPNRVAVPGDELVVHRFQTGTVGLASASDLRKRQDRLQEKRNRFWLRLRQFLNPPDTQSPPVISIPPGARLLVQDIPLRLQCEGSFKQVEEAVFSQVTAHVNTFRDAIRFHNGVKSYCRIWTKAKGFMFWTSLQKRKQRPDEREHDGIFSPISCVFPEVNICN